MRFRSHCRIVANLDRLEFCGQPPEVGLRLGDDGVVRPLEHVVMGNVDLPLLGLHFGSELCHCIAAENGVAGPWLVAGYEDWAFGTYISSGLASRA